MIILILKNDNINFYNILILKNLIYIYVICYMLNVNIAIISFSIFLYFIYNIICLY